MTKFGAVVFELCDRTDRQTDILITILRRFVMFRVSLRGSRVCNALLCRHFKRALKGHNHVVTNLFSCSLEAHPLTHSLLLTYQTVSEQFLNGTSAPNTLFSAMKLLQL